MEKKDVDKRKEERGERCEGENGKSEWVKKKGF